MKNIQGSEVVQELTMNSAAKWTTDTLDIPPAMDLDRILVYWRNGEPGQGYVTVTCYGAAWTSYFGAMGGRTIQQFFASCDADYLTNKLLDRQFQKCTKRHEQYLRKIVSAIHAALSRREVEGSAALAKARGCAAEVRDE